MTVQLQYVQVRNATLQINKYFSSRAHFTLLNLDRIWFNIHTYIHTYALIWKPKPNQTKTNVVSSRHYRRQRHFGVQRRRRRCLPRHLQARQGHGTVRRREYGLAAVCLCCLCQIQIQIDQAQATRRAQVRSVGSRPSISAPVRGSGWYWR